MAVLCSQGIAGEDDVVLHLHMDDVETLQQTPESERRESQSAKQLRELTRCRLPDA